MCELVGSPYEDHQFIIECAAGRHGLLQTPAQAEQKARDLANYFMRLIQRKEEQPADDLVSRIIEDHGGQIEVRSTPGKGSEFTIHLPVKQPRATAPTAPSEAEAAPTAPLAFA